MGFSISAASLPNSSPCSRELPHSSQTYRSLPSLRPRPRPRPGPSPKLRIPIRNPKSPTLRFTVAAQGGNQQLNGDNGGGEEGDARSERRRPPPLNLRWRDVLDPDPENIVAIGLTGLLTWASVQVLWQLLFISVAILLAALKYSFIAALLLFILITLL